MRASATPGTSGGDASGRLIAVSAAAGLAVLVAGAFVESAVIAAVRPSGHELEWISDALAAAAVTGLSYLWLHLRAARTRLLDLERVAVAIEEQLRLAAEIQRSLLPRIPAATPGYRWAARMVSAHRVGGDFYDFLERPGGAVLVILGDVSGKGLPAALLQSSLKTLFRVYAEDGDDPACIATRMSAALHAQTGGVPYATAILARFDAAPPRITYVNAGHPDGLVLGARTARLRSQGLPLGLFAGTLYIASSLELRPGDLGVLVSDGVTEAWEGRRSVEDLLPGPDEDRAPARVCDALMRAAAEGPGPAGLADWQDDRTALVFGVSS